MNQTERLAAIRELYPSHETLRDREARELLMEAFDFIPLDQPSLRVKILNWVAPLGTVSAEDIEWAKSKLAPQGGLDHE